MRKQYRNKRGQFISRKEYLLRSRIKKSLWRSVLKRPRDQKQRQNKPSKNSRRKSSIIKGVKFSGKVVTGYSYRIPKRFWSDRNMSGITRRILDKFKRVEADRYTFWSVHADFENFGERVVNSQAQGLNSASAFLSEFIEELYDVMDSFEDMTTRYAVENFTIKKVVLSVRREKE